MVTEYEGMKVYANFDKTQCGLEIAGNEGFFLTTDLENDEVHSPVLLQGEVDALAEAKDGPIKKLYDEIWHEQYFIILKNDF